MKRNIITTIGLFFLLVVLPAMSWVYLSQGLSYQKAKRAELKEFGKIPPFPYLLLNGDSIGESELGGKLLMIFNVSNKDAGSTEIILKELEKIHRQFDDRKDVIFLLQADRRDSLFLEELLSRLNLSDPGQVYSIVQTAGEYKQFGSGDYAAAQVAIADSSGIVRQYYDFLDGNRVRRSVEHIAMLMPFRDRDEAVLQREREK